jgi:hypothetical protein
MSQIRRRRGMGKGWVRVEKQAVEGKDPKWKPVECMRGRNGAE